MSTLIEGTERALIRRISSVKANALVQESAFKQIAAWSGASACRLAVEALLSHRLDRTSALYSPVSDWMREQKDVSLIIAVALAASTWPIDGAPQSASEILALLSSVSPVDPKLYGEIHQGSLSKCTWQGLCAMAGVENYTAVPKNPQLTDECRRLMTDSPVEARAIIATSYLETPETVAKMPNLRREIVRGILVWPHPEPLLESLKRNVLLLQDEVIELITSEEALRNKDEEAQKRHFDLCLSCTEALIACFEQMPEKKRRESADRLVSCRLPWLYPSSKEINEAATSPSVRLMFPDLWLGFKGKANQYISERLDGFPQAADVINELSPQTAASIFGSMGHGALHRPGVLEAFKRSIAGAPQVYAEALSPVIRSGSLSCSVLEAYLDMVGVTDDTREDVRSWLLTGEEDRLSYFTSEHLAFVQKHVIPNNLPAKRFLEFREPEKMIEVGYRLKPEDLTEDVIRRMLSGHTGHRNYNPFFDHSQWRKTMLTSDRCELLVVKGVLLVADNKIAEGQAWLEDVLPDSLTEKHVGLRRALIAIALQEEGLTQEGNEARLFLVRNNRMSWFTDEEKRLVPGFVKKVWAYLIGSEPEFANYWIQREDQFRLFFAELERKKSEWNLMSVGRSLFVKPEDKRRLSNWLLTHSNKLDPERWLEFVERFGLMSERQIRNHVHRLIDDEKEPVSLKALSVRDSYAAAEKAA